MKYTGQTFSYLKKNFWLPVVAMLIPSAAACFLSTPYWEVAFVAAFDYAPYQTVSQTFRILFGDSWQYLWPVVVISILQTFGASLIMSVIDRHFRTGRLSLRDPFRQINNSIFPLAVGVAVMSLLSVLWRFLLFGLVTLVQVVSDAMSLPTGAALAAISVLAVGLFILHVLILTPMLFWAPIMFIYGYRFRDAAASSFKLIAGKKLFIGLLLPVLLCAGIQLLVGFLQVHFAIACAVNFLIFMITNAYVTVYVMLTFYGISELDRRDLKPYHNAPIPSAVRKPDGVDQQSKKQKSASALPDGKPDEHKQKSQTVKTAKKDNAPPSRVKRAKITYKAPTKSETSAKRNVRLKDADHGSSVAENSDAGREAEADNGV